MYSTNQFNKSNEQLEFHVDGSIWKNGKLISERLTEDQEEWFEKRMHGSVRSWERWFVGQYFTEEQKKKLRLTDKDIEGKGMA
ncbi:MAG: hypothetical protein M3O68_03060 [Thermoproteota archaeon]|nr:hypothetical protein [Thermoproteota archaeon]